MNQPSNSDPSLLERLSEARIGYEIIKAKMPTNSNPTIDAPFFDPKDFNSPDQLGAALACVGLDVFKDNRSYDLEQVQECMNILAHLLLKAAPEPYLNYVENSKLDNGYRATLEWMGPIYEKAALSCGATTIQAKRLFAESIMVMSKNRNLSFVLVDAMASRSATGEQIFKGIEKYSASAGEPSRLRVPMPPGQAMALLEIIELTAGIKENPPLQPNSLALNKQKNSL